jgi:large subunit ribosomal protein L15
VHGIKDGIKLLGNSATTFKIPIDITVSCESASAIEGIEKAGGKSRLSSSTR